MIPNDSVCSQLGASLYVALDVKAVEPNSMKGIQDEDFEERPGIRVGAFRLGGFTTVALVMRLECEGYALERHSVTDILRTWEGQGRIGAFGAFCAHGDMILAVTGTIRPSRIRR